MKIKKISSCLCLMLFFAAASMNCYTNESGQLFLTNPTYSGEISNTDLKLLTLTSYEGTTGTVASLDLTPTFDPKVYLYNVSISSLTTQVTVVAVADDKRSVVNIDSTDCSSRTISVTEDSRNIEISVTAPDTVTTQTYTIAITRSLELTECRLLNAEVYSEENEPYTLSPVFDPDVISYKLRVAWDDDYIIIRPTSVSKAATIKVDNVKVDSGSEKLIIVAIAKGNTVATQTVTIKVAASSGDLSTYTVLISRGGKPASTPSEAGLQFIKVTMGANESSRQVYQDADGNLFPDNTDAFNKNVTGYSCVVFGFNTINVTAKAVSSNITDLTINGSGGTITDGKLTVEVALTAGEITTIPIHVVAEDGATSLDYTLRVRLLNIYEMFYGIYGPVARANKESWGAAGMPNWTKEFNGSISGVMQWKITWVTTLSTARNQMTYTDYNNGDWNMPFVGDNGGFMLNGIMSVVVNTSGTGTGPQTGDITMQTPEGDIVAIFHVHYKIVNKNAVSRDADSYTMVDYMNQTGVVLYYDSAPALLNLGSDYWDPETPWTVNSFWHP
ncbi:MAG TPA: cadherin-like beta sandwich domain-containing protein [Spirochaetota bacterium]|nr:cadherin-like beta sandwich domain-containing protein [Spirochaetota bacterium]HPV43780.1 cadherin-like beta sandwich domain-containing protein [Spirochaetota bacterium]